MGGALVLKTTVQIPQRIGAGATFHGAGLVTDKADSPHLLVARMKANMLVAIAGSDDTKQPEPKDVLRKSFAANQSAAVVEVYSATVHRWCVGDMALQNGKPIYDPAEAERAWA